MQNTLFTSAVTGEEKLRTDVIAIVQNEITVVDEHTPSPGEIQSEETIVLPEIISMTEYIRRHCEKEIVAACMNQICMLQLCVMYEGKFFQNVPGLGPIDYGEEELVLTDGPTPSEWGEPCAFSFDSNIYAAEIRPVDGSITWMSFRHIADGCIEAELTIEIEINFRYGSYNGSVSQKRSAAKEAPLVKKGKKMENVLDLTRLKGKKRFSLSGRFYGKDDVSGRELSFTNSYMQMNGKPFLGISGECHYARVHERQWEDTLLKMKMGGINTVATYVFWIHHEEQEGVFRFDGNRNVRRFLQLCKKHAMHVIVRIGPFAHGEVRNGGLPDWLYGKPFEVRSTNEGFLASTRRFYRKLAEQFEGLYFQDGGPIIAAQIENEYMHSASPWEMTTGITNEWVPAGGEGDAYMLALKKIAQEEGIVTPFYTCTAWGGAATPTEEMLPVWGGYAFWPWIFYDYRGPHPATPEYIYREYHNRDVPKTYNFEPVYDPESLPYVCCEMGGGMSCYYHYRFQLPYESVDAMANVKLASGCNFLGYYMYRGGSNPRGETTPFLNECQCPKISYDYQAPIGEFGQVRPSYYRLKALHQFAGNYQEQICELETVLPEGAQEIAPEDVDTLRCAVRTDGKRGFLFLNNYQDHVLCREKKNETIRLKTRQDDVVIPGISLAAGEEAILPFNLDVEGYRLVYARAQPLSVIRNENGAVCFFFCPSGMEPEYVWDGAGLLSVSGRRADQPTITVRPEAGRLSSYTLEGEHGTVRIVTLTREQSLMFYEVEKGGEKVAILCDSPLLFDGDRLLIESPCGGKTETLLLTYPGLCLKAEEKAVKAEPVGEGIWSGLKLRWDASALASEALAAKKVGLGRYIITLPPEADGCKDRLLQIRCRGDVSHAFSNGMLISDHFCNGAVWEIGLKEAMPSEQERELTILITPQKTEAAVNVSSAMAGRMEQMAAAVEELEEVKLQPVRETVVWMGTACSASGREAWTQENGNDDRGPAWESLYSETVSFG